MAAGKGKESTAPAQVALSPFPQSVGVTQLAIDERAVDVWVAFYDRFDGASLEGLLSLLNPDEQAKQARFRLADDRKRYLVTRAMVRSVLSQYADVPPDDWTFLTNKFGRPRIADRHGDACRLSFNISHTRGLIALGITRDRAIGIDVEHVAMREISKGIAEQYLSRAEAADLERVAEQRWQERFFEYWTFKESYIKARGMGLSIPLDSFSFHGLGEGCIGLVVDPTQGDDASRWHFWQCRPSTDHLLALCGDFGADCVSPRLLFREWGLLDSQASVVEVPILKSSRLER
jgi:4'-phosphopantetheinyl transferase